MNADATSDRPQSSLSAAISVSGKLADMLVSDNPQIAEDYRAGMNQREIALRYGLTTTMGHTMGVARSAISRALTVLIPDKEERMRLGRDKISQSTSRKPIEECLRGGLNSHASRAGIHAQTPEERREASIQAVLARKQIPWESHSFEIHTQLDELGYCRMLLESGEKTMVEIAQELNEIFHREEQIRTRASIYSVRRRKIRKPKEMDFE